MLRAFTLCLVCLIQYQEEKKLSGGEQIKILALNKARISGSNITKKIGRSKAAINCFLRNPEVYDSKKHSGRSKSLTERQARQIRKLACGQKMSSAQIQEQLQLPCSSRMARNVLSNNSIVQFKNIKENPLFLSTTKTLA